MTWKHDNVVPKIHPEDSVSNTGSKAYSKATKTGAIEGSHNSSNGTFCSCGGNKTGQDGATRARHTQMMRQKLDILEESRINPMCQRFEKFSTWNGLKKAIAWIYHYKNRLCEMVRRRKNGETADSDKGNEENKIIPITTDKLDNTHHYGSAKIKFPKHGGDFFLH
ncbi:Hypothetical predicted protein [Paramuricea clavata]|uniref:Uncharacterized protein n=1 Tax=Paramuricea clavata TaxID=317549 RepID=A0A6S7I8H5_PARCT|nr:Hypothetical predicted protein [Paramuricea clavata]